MLLGWPGGSELPSMWSMALWASRMERQGVSHKVQAGAMKQRRHKEQRMQWVSATFVPRRRYWRRQISCFVSVVERGLKGMP